MLFPLSIDGGGTEKAEVEVVVKASCPEAGAVIDCEHCKALIKVGDPLVVDPARGVAALVAPKVAPPKPENNALRARSQMVTNALGQGEYSQGAATPSRFSVVGAAAAVPVDWPPREKVGRVANGIQCESGEENKCYNNIPGAPSFLSSGLPSLFVVAPRLPKRPPPAAAVLIN